MKKVSYFAVLQVVKFIPTTLVIQMLFALEFAVRSWHPTWVLQQHLREERRVLQVEGLVVPFLSLIIKRG